MWEVYNNLSYQMDTIYVDYCRSELVMEFVLNNVYEKVLEKCKHYTNEGDYYDYK